MLRGSGGHSMEGAVATPTRRSAPSHLIMLRGVDSILGLDYAGHSFEDIRVEPSLKDRCFIGYGYHSVELIIGRRPVRSCSSDDLAGQGHGGNNDNNSLWRHGTSHDISCQ